MSASDSSPPLAVPAFTGERFVPSCGGEIAYEHWHRYAFARRFAAGKRVLDAACGEGYGTALLGAVATSVVGVDIDIATIDHARVTYGEDNRLRFFAASCSGLPLPSGSVDIVVSFETIEHLEAAEQSAMLSEFARVLAPDGILVISSPNKRLYSDARAYVNPFHLQELYRDDLARLLRARFPAQHWYHQRLAFWSGIWAERDEEQGALRRPEHGADPDTEGSNEAALAEAWVGDADHITPYSAPEGMYFIVVAARHAAALPAAGAGISLFTDADDSELKRAEANAHEVLRLDHLLKENAAALARQAGHVEHLEALVVERERLVVERDRQLAEADTALKERNTNFAALEKQLISLEIGRTRLESERTRLEAALAAQERVIAFQQSFRGWIGWPWRRVRHWLHRAR
jgi:SAM-dependent methyltransferase